MNMNFEIEDTARSHAEENTEISENQGPAALEEECFQSSAPVLKAPELFLNFPFFGGLSLAFGVMFTFCLYRNPCGITYPFFTGFACLCAVISCRKLGVPIKKDSWFLLTAAMLLGIATCRTADPFLILVNGIALVVLGSVFAIHQFYEDRTWNVGRYLRSVILYLFHALAALDIPFRHLSQYLKGQNNKTIKQLFAVFLGFAAVIPVLTVVIALLGAADAVFSRLMSEILGSFLRPTLLLRLLLRTVFAALCLYCLICSCCLHKLSEKPDRPGRANSLMALTGLSMIALVYLVFCGIQVIYLFLGKGSLPEGYTYSSYARQGFFQLLAVAFLNLIMVLCCLRYIRPHRGLTIILTLISICTYVMILSAGYRMSLYVKEYHLSYLRLLVIWFLIMLAVLMAGVSLMIWKPAFPLFRYSLAVVSCFYVALALARPDSIIGWNYVHHLDPADITRQDLYYLTRDLSPDAAPALAFLLRDSHVSLEFQPYDLYAVPGIRTYNFSVAQAKQLFPDSR